MKKLLFLTGLLLAIMSCGEVNIGSNSSSDSSSESTGVNGSYSKIVVAGGYLYGLSGRELTTLDISDKENVTTINVQQLAFDTESMYHYEGLLFVGSSRRLYIFEINESGIPIRSSTTDYFEIPEVNTACDPVVVQANYAYVTLHTSVISGPCGTIENVNELRVYDIADLKHPKLEKTVGMSQPKGLGVDGDLLFVCDGANGLVVFNVSNPLQPIKKFHFPGFDAYDLIARDDLLIVIATDKFIQFDYSDRNNIQLISEIAL